MKKVRAYLSVSDMLKQNFVVDYLHMYLMLMVVQKRFGDDMMKLYT